MSYFLKEEEPFVEYNHDNVLQEIYTNLAQSQIFNMFYRLECDFLENIDLILIRDVYVKKHESKGYLGYEKVINTIVQEILLISIQPQKNIQRLNISFPHKKIFYVSSWQDLENKLTRYLYESEDEQ